MWARKFHLESFLFRLRAAHGKGSKPGKPGTRLRDRTAEYSRRAATRASRAKKKELYPAAQAQDVVAVLRKLGAEDARSYLEELHLSTLRSYSLYLWLGVEPGNKEFIIGNLLHVAFAVARGLQETGDTEE